MIEVPTPANGTSIQVELVLSASANPLESFLALTFDSAIGVM